MILTGNTRLYVVRDIFLFHELSVDQQFQYQLSTPPLHLIIHGLSTDNIVADILFKQHYGTVASNNIDKMKFNSIQNREIPEYFLCDS